jgi:hypothetical protein
MSQVPNSPAGAGEALNAVAAWNLYLMSIQANARSVDGCGVPRIDRILQEVVAENISEVQGRLGMKGGVVTKLNLWAKTDTATLWRVLDDHMRCRAQRLGRLGDLDVPEKAFYSYNASGDSKGGYPDWLFRFKKYDVHHIWPEALEGPTEGWNLVALPKDVHLGALHPLLDDAVRRTAVGRRVRLVG